MALHPYDCAYCDALFAKASEHMSHVTKEHDVGFVPRGQRTFMPHMRCWSCAGQMPRRNDNSYFCESCGFLLPDKDQFSAAAEDRNNNNTTGDTNEG